ncbi:MAG: methyltransferase domain-containing protein [Puniceicoccales bacterium]|jgi:ADP-heptose:LPS heptosyltransferase|nr:methyltransferase domain-containing protein [Puniceicoccales bacterium]
MVEEGAYFYFSKLKSRIDGLQRKYANNEIKASLRLFWWSCRELFRTLFYSCLHSILKHLAKRNGDELRIAIVVAGGIGDTLIYGTAIKELSKRINYAHSIDLYTNEKGRKTILDFVFHRVHFLSNLIETNSWNILKKHGYNVIIHTNRYTNVLYYNSEYVGKKSKWLGNFCKKNKEFFAEHHKFFEHSPYYHTLIGQWSVLTGKTRIQESDQCGLLGIDDSTRLFLNLEPKNMKILKPFGLEEIQYITIQRGINAYEKTSESMRMWPTRYHEKFIKLFHEAYPAIKVVQLGHSNRLCKSMDGVDINLVGKTSLGELAVLLKHSLFHLDGEGGMVHVKRFLNGRSIVIFGPTSEKVFGYPENINLRGNGCSSWCEWVSDDWDNKCLRGFKEAPCMASVSPEMAMEAADKFLKDRKSFSYSVGWNNIGEDKIADHIFNQNANKKIKIVDISNKNGLSLAKTLRKNFDDIIVFDLNFPFDSFAKAEKDGLTLEYGCLYNISMPDNASDVVIWQNRDTAVTQITYIMKELFRILKPGGMLIVSDVSFQRADLSPFKILSKQCSPNKGVTIFSKTLAG